MARTLAEGVYEHLITRGLSGAIEQASPAFTESRTIERTDLPSILARHVQREVERALDDADVDEQLAIVEGLLGKLAELAPGDGADEQRVAAPARLLEAVYRTVAPLRPDTPLASTTLLTRNRAEPALGHELEREAASADGIDLLSAFITVGGVRVVRDALEAFARRGGKLRVLTSVFTGTTQVEAVDALARLPGAEVRVSYDVRRTRLHAKAWLFHRKTELHTAYVGSANLTATALGAGHEWMVKLCAADLPHVIDKFRGTFAGLCSDSEFEVYNPASDDHRARLRTALRAERASPEAVVHLFTLRPFPFQEEILDRLQAERALHCRHRNLLVAATGTGKTVIAAFDYARRATSLGHRPPLLFIAHRREILNQARETFRQVLRDAAFGELLGDGDTPERWEHVFATVQTAANVLPARVDAAHFDFVIIDECHHAPAESYQRLIQHLRPRILLGLTATPERVDGKSLLPDFDGRIAAELRLWHALDRQLLVPFEYYGISDGTDLRQIRWSRGAYHAADLASVYSGNEARVDLIVEQLRRRVVDPRTVRALAFCVSVEHAEFMARALSQRGVPSAAIHGGTSDLERDAAPRRLSSREVNVLCTCDLYNEGVDLPFVDTLLLLRPTSSATLFLQQLGRGLRVHDGKGSCLVLDFIGQHRTEYRLDAIYSAMTGVPQAKLARAVADGFPLLPSGCALELDPVARD
ncbi:MAG: DEAD/DEAH box helicase family protein, partial [Polyangiaceae bacterium]